MLVNGLRRNVANDTCQAALVLHFSEAKTMVEKSGSVLLWQHQAILMRGFDEPQRLVGALVSVMSGALLMLILADPSIDRCSLSEARHRILSPERTPRKDLLLT